MRLASWARIGISASIILFILWRVPAAAIEMAIEDLDGMWFSLACAAASATLVLRYVKWHFLIRAVNSTASPSHTARSLFGGWALNLITPGRLGELGRFIFAAKTERAEVLLLNILERGLDAWALASLLVASLCVTALRPLGVFAAGVWLAALPLVIGLPGLVSSLGGLARWQEEFRAEVRTAGSKILTLPTARFAFLSLASTSGDLLAYFLLLRAFSPASFLAALATFPWIVIAGGLPVSVGGIGLREGAAALLLARYQIPSAVAMDVGLLFSAFSSLLPALVGGAWFLATRRTADLANWKGIEGLFKSQQETGRKNPPAAWSTPSSLEDKEVLVLQKDQIIR